MKDLYKRIGLRQATNNVSEIERAIAATAVLVPIDAHAARRVLLDPTRKSTYDRTRSTLLIVGQLRHDMGLSHTQNWIRSDCADFDLLHSDKAQPANTQPNEPRSPSPNRPEHTGLLIVVLAAIFFLFTFVVMGWSTNNRNNSNTSPTRFTHTSSDGFLPPTYGKLKTPPQSDPRESAVRSFVLRRFSNTANAANSAAIEAAVRQLLDDKPEALPPTSVLRRTFPPFAGVAPLEIRTSVGQNFYIKVLDWNTKSEILTAFIRGGEPFEVQVPVGSYEIRYASGQSWYGPILDFGLGASYLRCDDRFDFVSTVDGYNGYTIQLILQRNGNLRTDQLSADQF